MCIRDRSASYYPISVDEYMEGDSPRIKKVYQLSLADDPSQIPTEDFERDGRLYYLLDMTRKDEVGVDIQKMCIRDRIYGRRRARPTPLSRR